LREYESALEQHGDTALGARWPNESQRRARFDVMLDTIERDGDEPIVLCDFACGTGELLSHIRRRGMPNIEYVGADRSGTAIAKARVKFPEIRFVQIDVGDPDADLSSLRCDVLVACGLFTAKFGMSHGHMRAFLERSVTALWPYVRRSIAFDVMSKAVDWERDDLFHYSLDDAARLLHGLAGRNVAFRADYGLYEYTAIARRPFDRAAPIASSASAPIDRERDPSTIDVCWKRSLRFDPLAVVEI
jgi:SAM-dependent methyltransferase